MSLDDLEDRVHDLRQRLRMRDELEALEADAALEGLVGSPPKTDGSGTIPKRTKRRKTEAKPSRPTPAPDGRKVEKASESDSPEEQAAAQLEASARRMVASWAGDPRVTALVSHVRPDFRALLDELGIDDADMLPASARILGMWPTAPDGTELPNFFAEWPPERLAAARLIASRVRAGIAEIVTRLRSEGVGRLPAIEHVSPDDDHRRVDPLPYLS